MKAASQKTQPKKLSNWKKSFLLAISLFYSSGLLAQNSTTATAATKINTSTSTTTAIAATSTETASSLATTLPVMTTTTTLPEATTSTKKLSLALGMEYSQPIAKDENSDLENYLDLVFVPSYKLTDLLTVFGKVALSQQLNGVQDTLVSDTEVGLSVKGLKINDRWSTLHSIAVVAPTSEKSQEVNKLKGAISINNGIAFSKNILTVKYILGLSRSFHEFEQNIDGEFMNEYGIKNTLDVKIQATEKLAASVVGIYRTAITYVNTPRYAFELHSDLGYDFTPQLSANVGVSNAGSALAANGLDSNISLYSEDTSYWRAGLFYSY